LFCAHFQPFADRYLLIGGTACDLAMAGAGTAAVLLLSFFNLDFDLANVFKVDLGLYFRLQLNDRAS
jgi:hypothetical protein